MSPRRRCFWFREKPSINENNPVFTDSLSLSLTLSLAFVHDFASRENNAKRYLWQRKTQWTHIQLRCWQSKFGNRWLIGPLGRTLNRRHTNTRDERTNSMTTLLRMNLRFNFRIVSHNRNCITTLRTGFVMLSIRSAPTMFWQMFSAHD